MAGGCYSAFAELASTRRVLCGSLGIPCLGARYYLNICEEIAAGRFSKASVFLLYGMISKNVPIALNSPASFGGRFESGLFTASNWAMP